MKFVKLTPGLTPESSVRADRAMRENPLPVILDLLKDLQQQQTVNNQRAPDSSKILEAVRELTYTRPRPVTRWKFTIHRDAEGLIDEVIASQVHKE